MDISAHVRLRSSAPLPLLAETHSALAYDFHQRKEVLHFEPSRQDDAVKVRLCAVRARDGGLPDGLDALSDQSDVVQMERLEVARVEYAAFAPCREQPGQSPVGMHPPNTRTHGKVGK